MLDHIGSCPGLSKGRYRCSECNASEKISKFHKPGCKERQPRKHALTGLLDQVRGKFSRSPSAEFLHPSKDHAQTQSKSWVNEQMAYSGTEISSQNYTGPQELSSETSPCELDAHKWFPMQLVQQDYPAGLELACNYDADIVLPLAEENFSPSPYNDPMRPVHRRQGSPPYNSEVQSMTETMGVRNLAHVQAPHTMNAIESGWSSRLRDGNTRFDYEHPTYKLPELPDTPLPCELQAQYITSYDSSFDVHNATRNALATPFPLSNNIQRSLYETSCPQLTRFDTKGTIDQQRLESSIDPPSSGVVVASAQRQLYADPIEPLASSNGSGYHWSSSAPPQQLLVSGFNLMAGYDATPKTSSPSDHPDYQTGFVSPVGSDTSLDHNLTISPASSSPSSIDQLLWGNILQVGTNQSSPPSDRSQVPSRTSYFDRPGYLGQITSGMAPVSSLPKISTGFRDMENSAGSAGSSQQPRAPKTSTNPPLAAPTESPISHPKQRHGNANHAPDAELNAPGVGLRCICEYEPKPDGKERNKASNLKRHQRTCRIYSPHTHNDKPFACNVHGCNKAYARPDGLAVHRRSRHGSLPDTKTGSRRLFSKGPKVEDACSSNGKSSPRLEIHRQGAIDVPKRPKRSALSLSPKQGWFEDGGTQRANPKRRRLAQEAVEPHS